MKIVIETRTVTDKQQPSRVPIDTSRDLDDWISLEDM